MNVCLGKCVANENRVPACLAILMTSTRYSAPRLLRLVFSQEMVVVVVVAEESLLDTDTANRVIGLTRAPHCDLN